MSTTEKSYHVAPLRTRNMITMAKNSDNTHDNNRATESLKALAGAALRRNQERNNSATCTQKTAQQNTVFSPSKVITPEASELRDIRAWLDRIGETDEEVIAEVLEKCRSDPEARRYYLCRATETEPRIHAVPESGIQRWMPGGECYERIRSGWRLSRTPDGGGYVWREPGTWEGAA
jgi:hypothetical protein